jgi:hypothetical protein
MSNSLIASLAADLKDSEQKVQQLKFRVAILEAALELIAVGKRPDGTYNRCREACELVAKEALRNACVSVSFDENGNIVYKMPQQERLDEGALGIVRGVMDDHRKMAKEHPNRLSIIADQYEELVNLVSGKSPIVWVTPQKEQLNASTIKYLENIIEPAGFSYKVATVRLGGTHLFKLDHPIDMIREAICYFHHDPVEGKHMWAGQGFHDALDNDRVLALLAEQCGVVLPAGFLVKLMGE